MTEEGTNDIIKEGINDIIKEAITFFFKLVLSGAELANPFSCFSETLTPIGRKIKNKIIQIIKKTTIYDTKLI